jgi:hypothetical protein
VDAINAWQHPIEDDRVIPGSERQIEPIVASVGDIHRILFRPKNPSHNLRQPLFIFHDEQSHRAESSPPTQVDPPPDRTALPGMPLTRLKGACSADHGDALFPEPLDSMP